MNATLLAQVLTFAVLVWLMNRLLWLPLTQLTHRRQVRLADAAAAAERARYDLDLAKRRAGEIRAAAREQADLVIANAERVAAGLSDTLRQQLRAEAQRLERSERDQVAQELTRLRAGLEDEIPELAQAAADRLLARPAEHRPFVFPTFPNPQP